MNNEKDFSKSSKAKLQLSPRNMNENNDFELDMDRLNAGIRDIAMESPINVVQSPPSTPPPNKPEKKHADSDKTSKFWDFDQFDGFYIPKTDIGKFSVDKQEKYLMRDLIYAFTGVPTSYIIPENSCDSFEELLMQEDLSTIKFKIMPKFNSSLRALAQQLLPLITHYLTVQAFIDEMTMNPDRGSISQKLSNAMFEYINNYLDMQSQLENELEANKLNLQKMVHHLRPTLDCMQLLADLVTQIRKENMNSAQTLGYLSEQYELMLSNKDLAKLLLELLTATATPYIEMIQTWTHSGIIFDPKQEFFVEDNEKPKMPTDTGSLSSFDYDYWNTRFIIHKDRIPSFLAKYAELIFNAGKQQSVLKQCGISPSTFKLKPLVYTPTERPALMQVLESNYKCQTKFLFDLFMKDFKLMSHFNSLKVFLLIQSGDFIEMLMEKCEKDLNKNVELASQEDLNAQFEDALKRSSTKSDPNMANVHCELLAYELPTHLSRIFGKDFNMSGSSIRSEGDLAHEVKCYEVFTLKYTIGWPVSVVLSRPSLVKLQLIFQELFFLRYVQQQLIKLWYLTKTGDIKNPVVCMIRQSMYTTIIGLEHYIKLDVIEPNWQKFMRKCQNVNNIETIIQEYGDFIDCCLNLSMFEMSPAITRSIFTLGRIAINFCEYVNKFAFDQSGLDMKSNFELDIMEYNNEFHDMLAAITETINEISRNNPSFKDLRKRLEFANASSSSDD